MNENFPENVSYEDQSAYDVADMVKQFFRDLPEPLFTNKLSETFLHIYQCKWYSAQPVLKRIHSPKKKKYIDWILIVQVIHACVLSCLSCIWLFATLWIVAHQAPLSMGFSRQKYWSWLPCPSLGDLPPRDRTHISWGPCIAGRLFTTEPPGKPYKQCMKYIKVTGVNFVHTLIWKSPGCILCIWKYFLT